MLRILNNMPDNVLAASAQGRITGSDYEDTLLPALEKKLKTYKKIRLLYYLGDQFNGFDLTAMLDDTKMGMKQLSSWDKIALVSDHHWINAFAKFFGYMLSCEIQIFKNSELDEAMKWVSNK
jgi:hypothetical protein